MLGLWPARAGTGLPSFFSASSVAIASFPEVCGGLVSSKSSRWCGGVVWRVERVFSVLSLTVSVVAQKKAADYT